MENYKHILLAAELVPEDDHPIAERAKQIADRNGAKLSIIHAVEYVYTYGVPPAPIDLSTWQQELEDDAKKKVTKMGEKLGIPENQIYLPVGSPKNMILDVAEKIGADLIVLGSHGKHGLGLLLGSTANGVLHSAKCDVLAVRVQS